MNLNVRLLFQIGALCLFIFQALNAFQKYLEYPVVVQTSEEKISKDTKTVFHICKNSQGFDFGKAKELGYPAYYLFLGGISSATDIPTWKGKDNNLTYEKLSDILFDKDFSDVEVNERTQRFFLFHDFYCLKTAIPTGKKLIVTTKRKALLMFPKHETTELKIASKITPQSMLALDVSNETTHYWRYKLSFEVHDDSIYEGTTCVDYRKLDEEYGDCLYKAFKQYAYSTYGCYPPWIGDLGDKVCETDLTPHRIENGRYENFLQDLDTIIDGDNIEMMKQCPRPCYTVTANLDEPLHTVNVYDFSYALISNEAETATVYKPAYSYDFFALITELGSSLGLWLGLSAVSFFDLIATQWMRIKGIICSVTRCKDAN